MQKDFITVTPDTGNGNATLNVTATRNTGVSRSSTIILSGKGVTKNVIVNQMAPVIPQIGALTFIPLNVGWQTWFDGTQIRPPYEFPIPVNNTIDLVYPRSKNEAASALIVFDAAIIDTIQRQDSHSLITNSYTDSQFGIQMPSSQGGIYNNDPVVINITLTDGKTMVFKYWELYV